jgi:hypothetical protein
MLDTQNEDPQCTACGSPLLRAVPMELLSKPGAVMVTAIARRAGGYRYGR